jgi:hypothetical protein
MSSNLQLAKALADFADGLAEYNHLPALSGVSVNVNPALPVTAGPDANDSVGNNLYAIAVWADTFDTAVRFITGRLVDVSTTVQIAGRDVVISQAFAPSEWQRFAAQFHLGFVLDGDEVTVSGARFRDAITRQAVA